MYKPPAIICDIDGTIADCSHRRHWVSPELFPGEKVKIRNTSGFATYLRTRREPEWEWPMHDLRLVDGTEVTWQTQSVKKVKRWDKFFAEVSKDTPIPMTIQAVRLFSENYRILFVSARPNKTRKDTREWMGKHLGHKLAACDLYMRADDDQREDSIVKREIYDTIIDPNYDVHLVLDDRDKVVSMWRRLGLTCWQVAEGNF